MQIAGFRRSRVFGLVGLMAVVTLAGAAQPTRKDSGLNIKPKVATLTTSVEPAQAAPGETVQLRVSAKVEPGWHIYSMTKSGGPKETTFDLFDTGGLKVAGNWKASREPTRKPEAAFGGLEVEFFENSVTWSIPLTVPPGTAPGPKALRVQASYQLCNDSTCTIPGRWTLPEATLTVTGGQAAAAAPAPAEPAEPLTEVPPVSQPETDPAPSPKRVESASSAQPVNQVEKSLEQGILPFLLLSAGAGLLALVMPCVWPMVPITVNFFVKQGQTRKGSTTGLALTYSLAIIGIFTAVGVLFSAIFGGAAAQDLATNPWLNVAVAGLFLAFGLSLLGVFEFQLPGFLLNASAQGESRGGLIGVVFMALTLVITSFTCTFPVVGALLVMAARGSYLYPVLGLVTFSTVLALPFFLLAMSPGLLAKLPRSGDWMNAVKVVGGLLEIGAAFKFINNAEIGFGTPMDHAWTNAPAVLTIWVVIALICGVYLLGLFRTDHDHDDVKVGPGRILVGLLFLAMALFLAPALFGRPPQSMIWDRLVVGLLPPDFTKTLIQAEPAASAPESQEPISSDPDEAPRQAKNFHGVWWGMSYPAALEQAQAQKKPVLIDFTGVFCANCRQMEASVMPRAEVVSLLKQFVTVQLYTDQVPINSLSLDQKEALAQKNQELQEKLAKELTNPFYVVLTPQGQVIDTLGGYREPSTFASFLRHSLDQFQSPEAIAQAGRLAKGP